MDRSFLQRHQSGTSGSSGTAPLRRWHVDHRGDIIDFDMRVLRQDILYRLQSGQDLYSVDECRAFVCALARIAAQWQEDEMTSLIFLAHMNQKILPGREVHFQFPLTYTQHIPLSKKSTLGVEQPNPQYHIIKLVEELNRSLVRLIDRLWNERRERLLLGAEMLEGLEQAMRIGVGADKTMSASTD